MKKIAHLILVVIFLMSFSSIVYAVDPVPHPIIVREISPGFDFGERTVGALFIGKFFNEEWTELGNATVVLDHNGQGIEICGGATELIKAKIILSFHAGGRLVLVGPSDGPVNAFWAWNDPVCEAGNCPLIDDTDYAYYVDLFDPLTISEPIDCVVGSNSYIADVPEFDLAKQRFGSYWTTFNGGSVLGWLVHTPFISPALFGTLYLNE
jgi:hypothetical protein